MIQEYEGQIRKLGLSIASSQPNLKAMEKYREAQDRLAEKVSVRGAIVCVWGMAEMVDLRGAIVFVCGGGGGGLCVFVGGF